MFFVTGYVVWQLYTQLLLEKFTSSLIMNLTNLWFKHI